MYHDKEAESGTIITNGALNNNEPANDDDMEMNNKNNFTTTTASINEASNQYEHQTALGEAEVRTGNIQNDYLDNTRNSNTKNSSEADGNSNENTISREECAWIDKQKQKIHVENATRGNTHEEEHSIHTNDKDADELPSYQIPDADRIEDAAALSVMIYLLVIAFLLAIAILIGTVVVSQYGFVVLVAVILAVGAMLLVFLVVISVIQGDRKLTKARSQIHKWSMEVKDVIMKEVADIKEDWNDFSSGMLLLTYDGELDMSSTTSDYVRDDFDNKENSNGTTSKRKRRKPKSIMFRLAVTPLKKLSRKHHNNQGSSDGKKRSWFRKKKTNIDGDDEEEGPNNNYYVPPSENFEVI